MMLMTALQQLEIHRRKASGAEVAAVLVQYAVDYRDKAAASAVLRRLVTGA